MQRNIRKKISTYKENLNYREAKYDEIDKINHIIKYGYHIKWDKDFFYKMIDNGTYILNIIKLEDEIIGFIAIQKIKDDKLYKAVLAKFPDADLIDATSNDEDDK